MYLQKVISTKKCFVDVLMIISENSRIRIRIRIRTRIHYSEVWIRGSGVVPYQNFMDPQHWLNQLAPKIAQSNRGKNCGLVGIWYSFRREKVAFDCVIPKNEGHTQWTHGAVPILSENTRHSYAIYNISYYFELYGRHCCYGTDYSSEMRYHSGTLFKKGCDRIWTQQCFGSWFIGSGPAYMFFMTRNF